MTSRLHREDRRFDSCRDHVIKEKIYIWVLSLKSMKHRTFLFMKQDFYKLAKSNATQRPPFNRLNRNEWLRVFKHLNAHQLEGFIEDSFNILLEEGPMDGSRSCDEEILELSLEKYLSENGNFYETLDGDIDYHPNCIPDGEKELATNAFGVYRALKSSRELVDA